MASSTSVLLLISFLHSTLSLHLPITKHASTNHYLTQIHLGSKPSTLLLIDLSSPSLWLTNHNSGTPLPSLSIPCSSAADPSKPPPPPATTCKILSRNPVSKQAGRGELVSDSFNHIIQHLLFVSAPKFLGNGLPEGVTGVFGLGRSSRISPITQLAHQLDLPEKFLLCLPRKKNEQGMIFGGKPPQIAKSLVYTPMEWGPSDDYFIRVKAMKIHSKKVSVGAMRGRLSTVDHLTKLAPGAYSTFVKAFMMAGEAVGLARVEPRGSYGVCYSKAEVVPEIDLVLQSEMVKWRIEGRNSMVEVEEGVMCLGVVDGGKDLEDEEIVIGGKMLEDVLMEFDLRSGMLGFTSSLIHKGTSCAHLSFDAAERRREF